MKIFSGECSTDLAKKVAAQFHTNLEECELSRFPNGENRVFLKENCENETVVIFQNFCVPVDQNILQFCLMVDAASRMNPKKIIGVIPWLGYAKQDKVFRPGEPLAASVVAQIISSLQLDFLYLLDIHHKSIKTYFSVPHEELYATDIFVEYAKKIISPSNAKQFAICAPDIGSLPRNQYIAEKLNLPLFQIDKERDRSTGAVQIRGIKEVHSPEFMVHGNKSNSDSTTSYKPITMNQKAFSFLMFDDMILSGGTIVKDTEYLKSLETGDIYFFATHLDPTPDTFENLENSSVTKIIVTDSLPYLVPENLKNKISEISVSTVFRDALKKT